MTLIVCFIPTSMEWFASCTRPHNTDHSILAKQQIWQDEFLLGFVMLHYTL